MVGGVVRSTTKAWQSDLLHCTLSASEHSPEPAGKYLKKIVVAKRL